MARLLRQREVKTHSALAMGEGAADLAQDLTVAGRSMA